MVKILVPWPDGRSIGAIDRPVLQAKAGVCHKADREKGIVRHTSIDPPAHWTKSGWHGWVYGWKLHLITTVAAVWIPLAADLTPANVADNVQALPLVDHLPHDAPASPRFRLGDVHDNDDNDPTLRERWETADRILVTTKWGSYPHHDDGVEVRRLFHQLRSHAIENFNSQFTGIFDGLGQVPTRRDILGAVFVYQLTLLQRYQTGGDLRVGLKAFIQAA